MVKIVKPGRVVVVLNGRFAGKKAVVVKAFDEGSKSRKFPHCLVAGIEKAPMKVTKRMSQKKIQKRLRVKPFVRYVNYNHVVPTRYALPTEIDAKTFVSDEQMDTSEGRKTAKTNLAKLLKETFQNPIAEKSGKPSKDLTFLKKQLRF